MNFIDIIFGTVFGLIMRLCYVATDNFAWAIVLFTIVVRALMFPLSLMSQKNSIILVKIKPILDDLQARYEGEFELLRKEQKALYKKEKYSAIKSLLPLLAQIPIIMGVISVVNNPIGHLGVHNQEEINAMFFGMDMLALPDGNLIIPILAIASTILLCVMQNLFNVISREQGFIGKYGVMVFLTVFTGWFVFVVPQGVGLFWTLSNITAVLALAICNYIYNPKKYIDYENRSVRIKPTREEKAAMREKRKIEKEREKVDMQRFFSVDKEVVFYSEASGFYKYFQGFIDYIIENSDITVHYLSSDINDQVFGLEKSQFEAYFCGSHGLITTFMKMDAPVVVMTMPDLNAYHYKRSIVRKDIEYIYTDHGLGSCNLTLRTGGLNNYDTIFCQSTDYNEEIMATERAYNLPEKNLVNVGFSLLDILLKNYDNMAERSNEVPQILIAPSWQRDNILEYCLDPLMESLLKLDCDVIIRPHPEFIKRFPGKMKKISEKYDNERNRVTIQTDFSSSETVYNSDLVITDWSSIALEFSLTTKKPSLFINTPMKVMNPEWRKIEIEPMDFWLRDNIGVSLDVDKLDKANEVVEDLLNRKDDYKTTILNFMSGRLYNVGHTAKAGGEYIIDQIMLRRE